MKHSYFITGTDTDVGKTLVSCGLLAVAQKRQLQTMALKPVASGCIETAEGLRNQDALDLMEAMTLNLPYQEVNPIALKATVAPHIAANKERSLISIDYLTNRCRLSLKHDFNLSLIEGAGGWRVPLNNLEMLSELPIMLNIPVILVVSMKLGCINHAVLTAESIRSDGLKLAGWVANQTDEPMTCFDDNLTTLEYYLAAPCLGSVPKLTHVDRYLIAKFLDLPCDLISVTSDH